MKFRLERIRHIEHLRAEVSRRSLAHAAADESAARAAAGESRNAFVVAGAEREAAIRPGGPVTDLALFERTLLANRVDRARDTLMAGLSSHAAAEKKLDGARVEYSAKRRREEGFDRLRERFVLQKKRDAEKAEEGDTDDLFSSTRRG
ncbi:MAG: hypothetical protein HY897_25120 [Deltaproteobacteria bacterium]|nr:hypothetical protein [Deltaproteobacteria bacterium]